MVKQGCIWLFGEWRDCGYWPVISTYRKVGQFCTPLALVKAHLNATIRVLLRSVADFQILALRGDGLWPLRTRQVRIQILYKTAHSRAAFNGREAV
jgi:hypothetical protein